jgi:hypothetical protein
VENNNRLNNQLYDLLFQNYSIYYRLLYIKISKNLSQKFRDFNINLKKSNTPESNNENLFDKLLSSSIYDNNIFYILGSLTFYIKLITFIKNIFIIKTILSIGVFPPDFIK